MRRPVGSSSTRAYWYSVSFSQITLSPCGPDLRVPSGSAIRAITTTGTTSAGTRNRASPGRAVTASSTAKTRNVRRVPANGISSSAAANVPTSDPKVESA